MIKTSIYQMGFLNFFYKNFKPLNLTALAKTITKFSTCTICFFFFKDREKGIKF